MRQRIKIAAALVHDPAVLLLDEPFNGVDPRQRMHLMDLLRRLGDEGRTVLFSSHILEEVERLARHIEVVVSGRHAASGDFGAIRRLMTDRPVQYAVSATTTAAWPPRSSREPSVRRRPLRRGGGSTCRSTTSAASPSACRGWPGSTACILELTPSDESLESVFAYLVGG